MSDIQEQIKIAHRKALEQDFNEIIKELKQEEHKNLELSMRINKAIEYMNDPDNFLCINVEEQGRVLMDEDSQNDLLNILKGDNK
jgi:DNA topoisomerase VI subunit A